MISIGHGYRTSHVVSTNFTVVIDLLSLYCVTSNHLVTGSIIVTDFKIRGSLNFLRILYRPMRSTHSLFHGVSFTILSGILPYFSVDYFVCWHVSHPVTYFCMASLIIGQYKFWRIITSVQSSPGQRRYVWYHFTTYFCSYCGMTIYPRKLRFL